jgi:putative tricarboxylic transport membrane protein
VEAPTLREAGVDLQFASWRGLVAPPGLSATDRQALTGLVDAMRASPEWAQVLARSNLTDAYLTGEAFGAFLRAEDARVAAVLNRLGLGI